MPRSIVISVYVIDHNPILLEGISCLIQTEPDLVLAGTASNLEDGLASICRVHPDCVVIDLDLRDASGLDVLSSVREAVPTAAIIGLITYEFDNRASDAIANGASAVLGKDQISQSLIELIRKHCGPV